VILAISGFALLVLLGIVQGATEFLPVSSHGHLVLLENWFDVPREGALSREIVLHLGTLVAVMIFCRKDLLAMLRSGSAGLWRLVVGSAVVTAAIGLPSQDLVETALATPLWIGLGLFANTLLMGVIAPRDDSRLTRTLDEGGWRDALVLGLLQAFALVPSVSRSGATIVAALLLGFRRTDAIRIAFLISLPVVGGAVLLQLLSSEGSAALAQPGMTAGLIVSLFVGLLALRFLAKHVNAASLRGFALYCLLLGTVVILFA
jgi:undecaprenyl-diphosphatase